MSQSDDPGAIFDAHVGAEFVERDVHATMATMTDAPYVTHVPVLTGGYGRDEVRRFYSSYFVGRWPADTQIKQISCTVGQGRVIDELIVSFTHNIEMPAMLPGIAPTGRKVWHHAGKNLVQSNVRRRHALQIESRHRDRRRYQERRSTARPASPSMMQERKRSLASASTMSGKR
jgi:hypothetical protein